MNPPNDREIFTPKLEQVPPMPELRSLYVKMGEEKIRSLVDRFYDLIAQSEIQDMFPKDLHQAKKDQADFMIQVLGGPSYYTDRKGHPRMRMRHFPFYITESKRQVWVNCYKEAIQKEGLESKVAETLINYLESFSRWMVNAKDTP
jgi:hemoglobin